MDVKTYESLIKKQTLSPGKEIVVFRAGTRVKFHFQTRKRSNGVLIDDSRLIGRPMELVLGKEFKLEVWEVMIQKMALFEIAKFTVDKSLITQYPFISKVLRDADKPSERRHLCGMAMQSEGTGYKDLDELFARPYDLEFVFELIAVDMPGEYEKQQWLMCDEEKLKSAVTLREKGNRLYKERKLDEAEECYRQAVGNIEQLMIKKSYISREKPHDVEWLELAVIKVPLLLNYAQCRLLAKDFYAVITHCNEALELDPKNVKALFRRARGHFGAWNPVESRRDFRKAAELDPSLQAAVAKEIRLVDEEQRLRDVEDRIKLQKLF